MHLFGAGEAAEAGEAGEVFIYTPISLWPRYLCISVAEKQAAVLEILSIQCIIYIINANDYSFIIVVHVTKPTCRSLHVRNEPEGVIASVVTMETDCGSDQLPWRIELLPGQRINVTLYDFVYASREIARQSSDAKCVAYAIFKEPNIVPSHTMCGGAERVSIGYVSVTEKVQIVIMKRSDAETHRYFVLKYTGQFHACITVSLFLSIHHSLYISVSLYACLCLSIALSVSVSLTLNVFISIHVYVQMPMFTIATLKNGQQRMGE